MSRKDSLLRLHERLLAKRDALRSKYVNELELTNRTIIRNDGVKDAGDAALDAESDALNTQLAALGSRELMQVERSIRQIRNGTYGLCDRCTKPIPIERLRALPFTPYCVNCQRLQEEHGLATDSYEADWESALEMESRLSDQEVRLGDLDVD